jgi:hypothetical protein
MNGHKRNHKTRILLLGSLPSDSGQLGLQREFEGIHEEMIRSSSRDLFEIHQRWEARAHRLQSVLMEVRPDVVHFAGHGNPSGELSFLGPRGTASPADAEAVAQVFRIIGGVRCVVLNACYSDRQAALLSRHVDAVVGMTRAVEDKYAIAFAAGFYGAVGYGRSVADAVALARTYGILSENRAADASRLYARPGVDPSQVFLHVRQGPVTQVDVEKALSRLFLSIFGSDELRRQVAFLPCGHELREELPTGPIPPAQLAAVVAELLVNRTALDPAWFDGTAEKIPRRRDQIMAAAAIWNQWESSLGSRSTS